jgi:flagellar motor protein MotB
MSASEYEDEDGEGYFASISDLMVGILFVFLLMLTVFALNFREAEDDQKVKRVELDRALEAVAEARKAADQAERRAQEKEHEADIERLKAAREQQAAEDEHRKNAQLRDLLRKAVARMSQDIEDRQNARLRLLARLERTLKDEGVTVILDPDSGVLRLPESLLFEKSQSTLGGGPDAPMAKRQAAQDALKKVSDALASVLPCYVATDARPDCESRDRATLEGVLIEGHSDRQPYREAGRTLSPEESRDRNDRLSVERALTVFKEIQQRNALDEIKNANGFPLLAVSAYGDRRPVAMRDTEEDYQKNRRIDLRFLLSARTSEELQRLIDEIKPALGDAP